MTSSSENPKLRLVDETQPAPQVIDPVLEAALDRMLAPQAVEGGIPADLENRILAQTLPLLGRRQGVIAVFRHLPRAGRIAAMLYFAGLLGIGFTGASIVHDAGIQVTLKRELPLAVTHLTQIAEQVPRRLATVDPSFSPMDPANLLVDLQSLETGLEQELGRIEQGWTTATGMNL